MSPRQKEEIPTWVYRVLIGAMNAIIMALVLGIHNDFKRELKEGNEKNKEQDLKIQSIEYRTSTLETTIQLGLKDHQPTNSVQIGQASSVRRSAKTLSNQ